MRHGSQRSLVLAVGAGLLLGYSAPFTKTAMDAFSDGVLHGFTRWELYAMIVTATLGTVWQQSSYQAGNVQTSLPTITIMKPVVAMVLGLTIYQEYLRNGVLGTIVVGVAVAVMLIATFILGRLSVVPPEPV